MRSRPWLTWTKAIAWTLLILLLSSLSTETLELPDFWDLFSIDKLGHALFYGILYYLWHVVVETKQFSKIFILIALLCILYGVLVELYQGYLLQTRTADWVDALANAIGVITALFILRKEKPGK